MTRTPDRKNGTDEIVASLRRKHFPPIQRNQIKPMFERRALIRAGIVAAIGAFSIVYFLAR